MDSTPLGKVFNEDNETSLEEGKDEEFIKFRKESSSKKMDSSPHQARKDFNQKREREVNARIFIKL